MSQTVSCGSISHAKYNNGWGSGFSTAETYGSPCYGKDSNGYHRCVVVKFTVPDFSYGANKYVTLNISFFRTTGGYDTFNYRISKDAPSFLEGARTEVSFPDTSACLSSGTSYIYTGASYSKISIKTSPGEYKANTVYYIWLWSDTPTGSTVGYYSNNASYGGKISVDFTYDATTKFAWTNPKVSGQPFNLTALEWNEFAEKVAIITGKTISRAVSGNEFKASMFNEAAEAVGLGTRVSKNDPIYAKYLNDLRDYLNARLE